MINPLFEAAMEGDIAGVEQAIADGISPNSTDESGRTPLMVAVYKNRAMLAETLIQHGANVNAKDKEGYSVIYYAGAHGNFESLISLYENGAFFDKNDPSFVETLEIAKENGHTHVVELLIAAEAKNK
ncbi:ankyrin repeat domain-containing protein [Fluviicola sp.]|uniref:ankyrin repeat domain-containing protein n=1 Tax=Fluviicola sp. TaxID=1917219 RepID=UPI0031D125C4